MTGSDQGGQAASDEASEAVIWVDPESAVPPYDQIKAQVRDQIRAGSLAPGTRLPSIRQLAGDLRVAPGTVARAYAELEAVGLLDSSRTRGTRVRPGQQADPETRRAAERFVAAARLTSTELIDVLGLVRTEWHRQS